MFLSCYSKKIFCLISFNRKLLLIANKEASGNFSIEIQQTQNSETVNYSDK